MTKTVWRIIEKVSITFFWSPNEYFPICCFWWVNWWFLDKILESVVFTFKSTVYNLHMVDSFILRTIIFTFSCVTHNLWNIDAHNSHITWNSTQFQGWGRIWIFWQRMMILYVRNVSILPRICALMLFSMLEGRGATCFIFLVWRIYGIILYGLCRCLNAVLSWKSYFILHSLLIRLCILIWLKLS